MKDHGIKTQQRRVECCHGAGTSASVLADILGSCEELRWMEPHMSSPSPCPCKVERVVVEDPLSRVGHTHTHKKKKWLTRPRSAQHVGSYHLTTFESCGATKASQPSERNTASYGSR